MIHNKNQNNFPSQLPNVLNFLADFHGIFVTCSWKNEFPAVSRSQLRFARLFPHPASLAVPLSFRAMQWHGPYAHSTGRSPHGTPPFGWIGLDRKCLWDDLWMERGWGTKTCWNILCWMFFWDYEALQPKKMGWHFFGQTTLGVRGLVRGVFHLFAQAKYLIIRSSYEIGDHKSIQP